MNTFAKIAYDLIFAKDLYIYIILKGVTYSRDFTFRL